MSSGNPTLGQPFFLYITATGSDTLKYQWYKSDTSAVGENNDSLIFDTLLLSDSGAYRCIVSNEKGADTSLTYNLVVIVPDTIRPEITLLSPTDSSLVTDSLVEFRYKIKDSSGISLVTINGTEVTSIDSIYTNILKLSLGLNTITAIAQDSSSSANRDTLVSVITYTTDPGDTIQPLITLLFPQDSSITADSLLEIRFSVKDASGVKTVTVNNEAVTSSDTLYVDTLVLSEGYNTIVITAVDSSVNANKDSILIVFKYDPSYLDTISPEIKLNAPNQGIIIDSSNIDISVDINDLAGIAWVTIAGDTVEPSREIYTKNVSLDTGINTIPVIAQDGSLHENKDSLLVNVVYDSVKPTLKLLYPQIDSSTIGSSSKKVEVIARDNYAIKSVVFSVGTDIFPTGSLQDTIFFATITGLAENVFTFINIKAVDTAGNSISITVAIKYDPTIEDTEPPAITQDSGPTNNDRVSVPTGTIEFTITDDNDIDTTYNTVNGTFASALTNTSGDNYDLDFNLGTNYGINVLAIHATDASTNHNHDSVVIRLNYNTVPSNISNISPVNNATGIENEGGVLISWDPAVDADLDTITYRLFYGTSPSNILSTPVSGQVAHTINGLNGATEYIWYVEVYTSPDTLRSPDLPNSYYRFTTINHPAVISGFNDFNTTINDVVPITITATDKEGIKEYRWDFNGDLTDDAVTTISSVNYQAPATVGAYNFILSLVDNAGGVTKDTAAVGITNNYPVIDSIPDTISAGINTNVDILVSASDDGLGIIYEFDFGGGFVSSDGDTTIKTQHTEEIKQVVVKIRDNDNNSVLDTFYINVGWLWNFYEFPEEVAGSEKKRYDYSTCKLGNYVYIGGGWIRPGPYPPIKRTDLWRTSDGKNWEKIIDAVPWGKGNSNYLNNYCFISSVKENSIYALGSIGSYNSVYKSVDFGNSWDSVCNLSDICFWLSNSTGEANDKYICIIGGADTAKCLSSPIHSLYPGNDFNGGFYNYYPERKDVSTTFYNDTIWFAGGQTNNGDLYDDLWFIKSNSKIPEERTVTGRFSKGYGGALIFFNDVMIYTPEEPEEIWYSKDRGRNWQLLNVSVPWTLIASVIEDGFTMNSKMLFFSNKGIFVSENCP